MKPILIDKKKALRAGLLLALCVLTFVYCFIYIEETGRYSESYSPDEGNYIAMARRLVAGEAYSYWGKAPDAYVSPGFPLFLVVCMKLFGTGVSGIFAIKIVQGVLTALTVLLTFLLGQQLTKRFCVGYIAAVLVAANGSFAFLSRFLLTETFYYFAMMLFFVVFVYTIQRKNVWWMHLVCGVLFCVSVMVRPLLAVVAPVMYLALFCRAKDRRRSVCFLAGFFAGGFILAALPWWIRNIVTMGRFILFATQTNPIYAGLAKDVKALGLTDPGSFGGNIRLLFRLLAERPLETIYWMTFGKFHIIFLKEPDVRMLTVITTMIRQISLYFGFLGALLSLFLQKVRWPAIVFLVYTAASFAFVPTARYGLQYMPFLAIFAGYVLVLLAGRIRPLSEKQTLFT